MSTSLRAMPWFKRPSLSVVAAPAARLLSLAKSERRIPHDMREIERYRMELEMKRAMLDASFRFKVM